VRIGPDPSRLPELWTAFKRASLALVTPVIIMGGIFGGIFTPTEAAAVAAIYSLALGLFIYREMSWRDPPRVIMPFLVPLLVVQVIVTYWPGLVLFLPRLFFD
jgi:C4-dicarboxylate transporter DctM subunit